MYLVIGGSSFLGSYVIKNILESTKEDVIATYHSAMPFSDDKRIQWIKYDINNSEDFAILSNTLQKSGEAFKCVYLSGCIKPDVVAKNPTEAYKTNIEGLKNFINKNKNYLEKLYFASTDMVFDENEEYKYKESDAVCPMNEYGVQKSECEKIVTENGFNVFRCPLMFGKSLVPNRIHFIDHIQDAMTKGYEFEVLADYYESSLDYNSVAKILLKLIDINNFNQIVHICADEKISKYQIAIEYAKKYNLKSEFIKPIKLSDADFFVAKRGSVLLDNSLVKSLLKTDKIEREL